MINFATVNEGRMKIDNLDIVKHLIAGTEGGLVEFKKTTGQLERGISVCQNQDFALVGTFRRNV